MTDLREEIVAADPESVDDFRARARAWIRGNLPASTPSDQIGYLRPRFTDDEELAEVDEARQLQRKFFDAGLAGVCFPREYGGLGLTPAHQMALREELSGFAYPFRIQAPTFSPCAAVLLEFGTRRAEAPPPPGDHQGRGVVDAAPVRAERRFRRGGRADDRGARRRRVDPQRVEGLDDRCLVLRLGAVPRPDELGRAEAPRAVGVHLPAAPARHRDPPHRDAQRLQGLLPGVHHRRARARLAPASATSTKGGRSVPAGCSTSGCCTTRRTSRPRRATPAALDGACTTSTSPATAAASTTRCAATCSARRTCWNSSVKRSSIGSPRASRRARCPTRPHRSGGCTAASRRRAPRRRSPSSSPARAATAWDDTDGAAAEIGNDYLLRQVSTLGGGTTEMARNVICERVLGMPRELSYDRNTPFRDVPKGPPSK